MKTKVISALMLSTLLASSAFAMKGDKEDRDPQQVNVSTKPSVTLAIAPLPNVITLKILGDVPFKDLVKFRRVNKKWRELVDKSPQGKAVSTLKSVPKYKEKLDPNNPSPWVQGHFAHYSTEIEKSSERQLAHHYLSSLSSDELSQFTEAIPNLFQIPESVLDITELNLSNLGLKYLSPVIGEFVNVEWLRLFTNLLITVPNSLGNLSKLENLTMSENQLIEVPDSLGNLPKLERLLLHSNQLRKVPESIRNLSNLRELILDANQLTELPKGVCDLTNLEELWLNENQFTEVPDSLRGLSNLKYLFMHTNQLTTVPEWVSNLPKLEWVLFNSNSFSESKKESIRVRFSHIQDFEI